MKMTGVRTVVDISVCVNLGGKMKKNTKGTAIERPY